MEYEFRIRIVKDSRLYSYGVSSFLQVDCNKVRPKKETDEKEKRV